MHPAYSIIFFTTASGAGYGLMALLAVFGAAGLVTPAPFLGGVGFALSAALVAFGLLSSTFHLGHPERAWRAFSQWRSSWLSREAVLSLATFAPALVTAYGWIVEGEVKGGWARAGYATAALAGARDICAERIADTAEIRKQLDFASWPSADDVECRLRLGAPDERQDVDELQLLVQSFFQLRYRKKKVKTTTGVREEAECSTLCGNVWASHVATAQKGTPPTRRCACWRR